MRLTKAKFPWLYETSDKGKPLYPHVFIADQGGTFEAHYWDRGEAANEPG